MNDPGRSDPARPRSAWRPAWVVVLLLAATSVAMATGGSEAAEVVLSDLDGNPVRPLADRSSATVFLFARTDCPISNRYAPEVRELYRTFAPRGIRFWLVFLDRDQPSDEIRGHLDEFDYPLPALRDPEHALVRATGATITPEAALFTPDGRLVYRGRIDNRYVAFGKARAVPTRHDLALALEAVLAGNDPEVRETPAVGCFIGDLE